jgi:hypothetical protein
MARGPEGKYSSHINPFLPLPLLPSSAIRLFIAFEW